MTDHASLLRQIRTDARPYIEQALDLSEVFTGFRKLASENGLDWGVIKALIKAEVQDEREGGDEKVSRIIEKADFASTYADMLGLGTAKMNEENLISELHKRHDGGVVSVEVVMADLPPHDSETGEITDPVSGQPDTEAGTGGVGFATPSSSPATIPHGTAPVSGDAGGLQVVSARVLPTDQKAQDASPIPQPAAGLPSAAAPVELSPIPDIAPGAPFELEDIPDCLRRVA